MIMFTSFRNIAFLKRPVYAGKRSGVRSLTLALTLSTFISGVAVCPLLSGTCLATTTKELQGSIAALSTKLASTEATVNTLKGDIDRLLTKISLTNLNRSILLVAGLVSGKAGSTAQVPITLIPGPFQTTAFQATIMLPAGFTLKSLTAGPASLAAEKTISYNPNNGIFLLFGLNQTPVGAGVAAIATINIPPGTKPRIYPILLIDPVASDLDGNALDMCTTSGEIKL